MDKKEFNNANELYNDPLISEVNKIYLCFSDKTEKICISKYYVDK